MVIIHQYFYVHMANDPGPAVNKNKIDGIDPTLFVTFLQVKQIIELYSPGPLTFFSTGLSRVTFTSTGHSGG